MKESGTIRKPSSSQAQAASPPTVTTAPATNGATLAKRPKGGAPNGNRNAYRHGLYSPRGPKSERYIDRAAGLFRRHLESCVLAEHGEISVLDASLIQSAAEAARVALAEFHELRTLHEQL